VPEGLDNLTWSEKADMVYNEEERINSLKKVASSFIRVAPFFEEIATDMMLPRKLWLIEMTTSEYLGILKGTLGGYIFRDDDYEERLGVDELISNLKRSIIVRSIFNKVSLEFSNRELIDSFEATKFSIALEQ